MPAKGKRLSLGIGVAALAVAGLLAFAEHPLPPQGQAANVVPAPQLAQQVVQGPAVAQAPTRQAPGVSMLHDFSGIVAQMGPAVVNISVSGSVALSEAIPGLPKLDPNDPFYEFFRRFAPPQAQAPVRGLGSGFLISQDGMILTNAHVAENADEVTVTLTDGREFKAKVLGLDKPTDIAVLKIAANNLPTVRIGDSKSVRVGEWVLAIGSPFGFDNSATAGIVSATSRSLPNEGYVPFIQTDVAVNPGNSGGPLFNVRGEVIGINSAIYSSSGGYQGLAFAIPIDVAMDVQRQIVAHGRVERGRLGIAIQNVNQSLAQAFGLQRPTGALVSSVDPGGPGDKAGLQPGDVILALNQTAINRSSDLPPLVAGLKPGSTARLEIWRNGQRRTLTATVGEFPAEDRAVAGNAKPDDQGRLGLAVRPLSAEEKRQLNAAAGVVVQQAQGPAARAGVRPGDVILAVNGTAVTSAEQLRSLIGKAKSVALLVQRGEARIFIPVELG